MLKPEICTINHKYGVKLSEEPSWNIKFINQPTLLKCISLSRGQTNYSNLTNTLITAWIYVLFRKVKSTTYYKNFDLKNETVIKKVIDKNSNCSRK